MVTSARDALTPTTALDPGEEVIAEFGADRRAYWRTNAWICAFAMALGMAVLWAIGNPHVWTGAVGGFAAIVVRAFYLASDELHMRWDLTNSRLLGPGERSILLGNIAEIRALGSSVQVVTIIGDKHLIKNQAAPQSVIETINEARR